MVELGDHLVEEVYEVGPGPGAGGAERADAGLEVLELGLIINGLVLDDAEILEAAHVQGLVVSVEFLEILFSGGVTGKEVYRPRALGLEFGNVGTGLVLSGTVDGFVTRALQVAFCYLAEGYEVQALVEFGKEDIAVVTQEAGAQAQFARFMGGGSGRAPTCGRVGLYAPSPRYAAGFTLRSLTLTERLLPV